MQNREIEKLENEALSLQKRLAQFLSTNHIEELNPSLQLWCQIDATAVTHFQTLLATVKTIKYEIEVANALAGIMTDAQLVSERLKQLHRLSLVGKYFCETQLFRKQQNFSQALTAVQNWIKTILSYQDNFYKLSLASIAEELNQWLASAYHHQAKIYRCLAGRDIENLSLKQLKKSKESYIKALCLTNDHPIISIGLACLYHDMALQIADPDEREQVLITSLTRHKKTRKAGRIDPFISHGIASALYQIEKCKVETDREISRENLYEAITEFAFVHQKNPNARAYYEEGMVYQLLNNEAALISFKKAIALNPDYLPLLLDFGKYLIKHNDMSAGLACLLHGRTLCQSNSKHRKKFSTCIDEGLANVTSTLSLPVIHSLPVLSIVQDKKVKKIQDALKKCKVNLQSSSSTLKKPTVFISYAWGNRQQEAQVALLAEHLTLMGAQVFFDKWYDRAGFELMTFVKKIMEVDYVLLIGTRLYLEKYQRNAQSLSDQEHIVKLEMYLIEKLISLNSKRRENVIPLLLEGNCNESLPTVVWPKLALFYDTETHRYESLFKLMRIIHEVDNRNPTINKIEQDFFEEVRTHSQCSYKQSSSTFFSGIQDNKVLSKQYFCSTLLRK